MANDGTSRITLNATLTAIRFLFNVTLDHPERVRDLTSVSVPQKLPIILSREEVARLIHATDKPKYKTAFSVAYGAGLRVSEIASLKISDIDRQEYGTFSLTDLLVSFYIFTDIFLNFFPEPSVCRISVISSMPYQIHRNSPTIERKFCILQTLVTKLGHHTKFY